MRYVFIVNPQAGKKKLHLKVLKKIKLYFLKYGGNYKIYITEYPKHGKDIAREEARKGGDLRIYSCGGDGSLHDVVNGVYGYPNVEIGLIPCGSGNDFVQYFENRESFFDLEGQVKGSSVFIDLIKCEDIYCINQACIGMDAEVAANMYRFKNLPLITGSFAYVLSVFYGFLHNVQNHFTVQIDDLPPIENDFLFAVAANATHYGGGYKSAPDAKVNDCLLDFVLVYSVSRMKIMQLMPIYRKGKHIDMPNICCAFRGAKMTVDSGKEVAVALDGEIIRKKNITFELIERGIRFIVPRYCAVKDKDTVKNEASRVVPSASWDLRP